MCVNCGLDHGARDKVCQKFKGEVELLRLKVDRRVSMSAARKIYFSELSSTPVCPVVDSGSSVPLEEVDVEGMDVPALISDVVSDVAMCDLVWKFVKELYGIFSSSRPCEGSRFHMLCSLASVHAVAVASSVCKIAECGSGGLT